MIGMIRTEYDREIEQLKCKHIEALEQHRQKLQVSTPSFVDLPLTIAVGPSLVDPAKTAVLIVYSKLLGIY